MKTNLKKEEIREAKIYIISLQPNKKIKDFYNVNKIKGCNFIEITKADDLRKIIDADIIYFLSQEDINSEFKQELKKIKQPDTLKIIISPKELTNLRDICTTYITTEDDYKKIHHFLKQIIETICVPSLIGFDYADIKTLFLMSPNMIFKSYKTKINEKEKIMSMIKRDFKTMEICFFVLNGCQGFSLDDVNYFENELSKISKSHTLFNANINEELKDNLELNLFVGMRVEFLYPIPKILSSILKPSFIFLMIHPFQNNRNNHNLTTFNCINQSPSIWKIIFP